MYPSIDSSSAMTTSVIAALSWAADWPDVVTIPTGEVRYG